MAGKLILCRLHDQRPALKPATAGGLSVRRLHDVTVMDRRDKKTLSQAS